MEIYKGARTDKKNLSRPDHLTYEERERFLTIDSERETDVALAAEDEGKTLVDVRQDKRLYEQALKQAKAVITAARASLDSIAPIALEIPSIRVTAISATNIAPPEGTHSTSLSSGNSQPRTRSR